MTLLTAQSRTVLFAGAQFSAVTSLLHKLVPGLAVPTVYVFPHVPGHVFTTAQADPPLVVWRLATNMTYNITVITTTVNVLSHVLGQLFTTAQADPPLVV